MNAASRFPRPASFKPLVKYLAALALIVVVLAWQADVFKSKLEPGEMEDRRPRAEGVDTVKAREVELPVQRLLPGSLMPRETVELAAQVSGEIASVEVEAGDRVGRGEVVMRIDPELPEARRAEARAALEMARADLDGAERLLSHVEAAAEANALPEVEAIDARRVRDRAARAVDRRRAALDAAETRLGYTELTSPLSGVVIDTLRDPGGLVMPGAPVMLLYDPERLEVVVPVPARLAGICETGRDVDCEIEALGITLPGVVRTRVRRVDPATRTVMVKLEITPPDGALPGMYVRVRLEDRPEKTVVVPASAVGSLRGMRYVRGVSSGGRVDKRLVRPGRRVGDRVEILAGLEPGDRVLREYGAGLGGGEAE